MSGPARVLLTGREGARQALADLVMAWARDIATGQPRYILELTPSQRGAHCGCECASCGLPLIAVNAGKTEFMRRPHFRHPEGTQRDDCMVLTARVAVLRQLQDAGWIDLPKRRVTAQVMGLSGQYHDAWVEAPPQRMRISEVDYRDRAAAVVTLDDGRQFLVGLTGSPGQAGQSDGGGPPTIFLGTDAPELAGMDPAELRERARLVPTEVCWHSHWNDAQLRAQAELAAREAAHFYFDDVPSWLELPPDLDPALRRETVLHYEVKRILEQEGRLTVPELRVEASCPGVDGGTVTESWLLDEEDLRLNCVRLEQRFGQLIPDVTCEAFDDEHARYLPLLIEVTVTNVIDEERLERIRENHEATLEIDLSRAGGRVNRKEFRQLVVDEVALKRWLFHPDELPMQNQLNRALLGRVRREREDIAERARLTAEREAQVRAMPLTTIAADYLHAVKALQIATGNPIEAPTAREALADAVEKLALRGFPEAGDENLLERDGILARLLSIRWNRPVGYGHEHLTDVLDEIRSTRGARQSEFSLYLIAVNAYPPGFDADQQRWFDGWAGEVRASLRRRERTYLRDPSYDRLLALLFPEMAPGLAKKGGKLETVYELILDPKRGIFVRPETPERRPAKFIANQPRARQNGQRLLDTGPGDVRLKGRDLEAWKRANPEWARAWFPEEFDDDSPAT